MDAGLRTPDPRIPLAETPRRRGDKTQSTDAGSRPPQRLCASARDSGLQTPDTGLPSLGRINRIHMIRPQPRTPDSGPRTPDYPASGGLDSPTAPGYSCVL